MTDLEIMQETLRLARQGSGLVSPNPLVGSVVIANNAIVGRGFHRYAELKHAEIWALDQAGPLAAGAALYVNLEPCSHSGNGKRTEPCVDAIIAAGVRRVVASMVDPNPKVNGRGFARLREAGIEVAIGLLENEARRMNEKYLKFVSTGLPFVHLKLACSLDGRIATRTGNSQWITGEKARLAAHHLRHEYDAILVGLGTAAADDPMLTDRSGSERHRPLVRIVLDAGLRISPKSQLVRTAKETPLVVFAADCEIIDSMGFPVFTEWGGTFEERQSLLSGLGVEIVRVSVNGAQLLLGEVFREIGKRSITSVLIEGGAEVSGSLVEQRLVDKFTFFMAPRIIGGRDARSSIGGEGIDSIGDALQLGDLSLKRLDGDLEITGYPVA